MPFLPQQPRHRRSALPFGSIALMVAFTSGFVSARSSDGPPDPTRPDKSSLHGTITTKKPQTGKVSRKPRTEELALERRDMVRRQIAARGVTDPHVLTAMRNVPRHLFVPDELRHRAYDDRPLPIGMRQTISQPYIVALMTEALELSPDARVLEIGTGSGYQAAVLSEITPHVFTIEIVAPLARRAIATFTRHGYQTIQARIGDGYAGWPEHAPFDAIIVTCAPDHIPECLVAQLAPGGRMCIPVGDELEVQRLVVVTKKEDGSLDRKNLMPVRFVPMTGAARDDVSGD